MSDDKPTIGSVVQLTAAPTGPFHNCLDCSAKDRVIESLQAQLAEARLHALNDVLRGLRSEDGSQQLRAIIASVEAMRDTAIAAQEDKT